MCSGACSEALCCWDGTASCADNSNCAPYKNNCVNMNAVDNQSGSTSNQQIPQPPEYLAAACSESSLNQAAGKSEEK